MSELLLELFSEEIPARMQKRASEDLSRMVTDALKAAGVESANARAFATPRRLTLVIDGLPDKTPDVKEERKGPKVGAPEKAIEGFLRAAGLTSIDQATVQEDKKGAFYLAVTDKPGRATADLIAEIVPDVIRNFPWPKSMRWGTGTLRWVRPLHSILCLLGGKVVPFELEGITSGDKTRGHRFMAPDAFAVTDFADYEAKLKSAHVILDPAERAKEIHEGALHLAQEAGLHLFEDEALLHEVAGLVEWPVPLIGKIDDDFMTVPQEVLTSTMRANQKYFALTDAEGKLAPRFIVVANIIAEDGGAAIVNGNERVLRARFSDARFLWDQDKKHTLDWWSGKLVEVKFFDALGDMEDKSRRIQMAAYEIVDFVPSANRLDIDDAALLCKADLVTGMVYEFPELQGVVGRYYALNDGLRTEVADAIAEHYAPVGPSDNIPESSLGKVIALADKLVSLVGFFGVNERPTGSKDPFALRRAALGVIRVLLEGNIRLPLSPVMNSIKRSYDDGFQKLIRSNDPDYRHRFADEGQDDLVLIVKRVEALSAFLATDDGANLLAGYKRAVNILKIEEKKDGTTFDGVPDRGTLPQEQALFDAIAKASKEAETAVKAEDFAAAMGALAQLRAPVDAFFEHVKVNEEGFRENRLKMLAQIRAALHTVADFSKVEG